MDLLLLRICTLKWFRIMKLLKMTKDVLAGLVLDYKERFDSNLSTIRHPVQVSR